MKALIDEDKIAGHIETILDEGVKILKKDDNLDQDDHARLKVIRTLGSHISNAVILVQQRTARERHEIVRQRIEQMKLEKGLPMESKKQIAAS